MAIGTTNITTTLVRSTLQEDNNSVVGLANSEKINKWSKKKPVRGEWPYSDNANYGIEPLALWAYQRPRGIVYLEPYRMGDFRGYEHNQTLTLPPAYVRHDWTTFVGRSEYSPTGYYTISGTLKINTGQPSEITLSDLGLEGYYFGMCVAQPSHSAFWYKTLGVVVADNQYISGSIAMSSPYTSYNDFPFLYQDSSQITVAFVLVSAPATTWTSGNAGLRLPQEIVAGIDMRSSYNMTIAHWIIPDPATISFPYQYYSETGSLIHSDINKYTLPAGWVIISKPSWITTRVYNNPDNRITTGPFYDNFSLLATPTSNNNGAPRYGTIAIGDTSSHQIGQVGVHQHGAPPKAHIHIIGFNATGISAVFASEYANGKILVKFTPTDLSDTSVYVSVTVFDGYTQVGFDGDHMSRNDPYTTSFYVDVSPAGYEGATYDVYVTEGRAPYLID